MNPIMIDKDPAPENLLKIVRCTCRTNCRSLRCSCRKHGVVCTKACTNCTETCNNIPAIESSIGDDRQTQVCVLSNKCFSVVIRISIVYIMWFYCCTINTCTYFNTLCFMNTKQLSIHPIYYNSWQINIHDSVVLF